LLTWHIERWQDVSVLLAWHTSADRTSFLLTWHTSADSTSLFCWHGTLSADMTSLFCWHGTGVLTERLYFADISHECWQDVYVMLTWHIKRW
jgi:hypothetical protein